VRKKKSHNNDSDDDAAADDDNNRGLFKWLINFCKRNSHYHFEASPTYFPFRLAFYGVFFSANPVTARTVNSFIPLLSALICEICHLGNLYFYLFSQSSRPQGCIPPSSS
jgi:hypothetical protein